MLRLLILVLAVSASGCASVGTPIQATTLAEVNQHLRKRSDDRARTIELVRGGSIRAFNIEVNEEETTWTPTSAGVPTRRMSTSDVRQIHTPRLSPKDTKVLIPVAGIAVGASFGALAVGNECPTCGIGPGLAQLFGSIVGGAVGLFAGGAIMSNVGTDYTVIYQAPLSRYTDVAPEAAPN